MRIKGTDLADTYRIGTYRFIVKNKSKVVLMYDDMQDSTIGNVHLRTFLTKYMKITYTIVLETDTFYTYLIEHDACYGELHISEKYGEQITISDVDVYDSAKIIAEMIRNGNFIEGLKIPEEWL